MTGPTEPGERNSMLTHFIIDHFGYKHSNGHIFRDRVCLYPTRNKIQGISHSDTCVGYLSNNNVSIVT